MFNAAAIFGSGTLRLTRYKNGKQSDVITGAAAVNSNNRNDTETKSQSSNL